VGGPQWVGRSATGVAGTDTSALWITRPRRRAPRVVVAHGARCATSTGDARRGVARGAGTSQRAREPRNVRENHATYARTTQRTREPRKRRGNLATCAGTSARKARGASGESESGAGHLGEAGRTDAVSAAQPLHILCGPRAVCATAKRLSRLRLCGPRAGCATRGG